MKKLTVLFTALFCLTAIFTSCEKEDPDNTQKDPSKIEAKVVNGNDYNSKIDSVFVIYNTFTETETGYDYDTFILGKSKYTNGGFSMTLAPVPSGHLDLVTEEFDDEGLTISDKTAKCLLLDEEDNFMAKKGNDQVGLFFSSNISLKDLISDEQPIGTGVVYYIYVDKNVKITGTVTDEADQNDKVEDKYYYNLSLKAGWNTFAYKLKSNSDKLEEVELTTAENLTNYKWYFFEE